MPFIFTKIDFKIKLILVFKNQIKISDRENSAGN